MRRQALALLAISAAFPSGLVACGDDDDSEPSRPSEQTGGRERSGREIFDQQGCGSCHTHAAANATGEVGPNLDETLQGQSRSSIRQSIVAPNAEIVQGFNEGIMPTDFGDKLSEEQLDRLVTFLSQSAGS
jgi:mono/diheme cytochrome c family protein